MGEIKCKNISCKFHRKDDFCEQDIVISPAGKCQSFEKGFFYYFGLPLKALKSKNYIDLIELDMEPDLRIGLYYLMECYGLGFKEMEWGTSRMILLVVDEDREGLNADAICQRKINIDKMNCLFIDFQNGILPKRKPQYPKSGPKEFGWLSPRGDFTESSIGEHEDVALKICEKYGFLNDFLRWYTEQRNNGKWVLKKDFLLNVKGYCLIHNPAANGGYIVSHSKSLTKKQKEFLYKYFMDMGDRFKAEQYMNS